MATPQLTLREAKRRLAAINKAIRAGYRPHGRTGHGPGAIAVAAAALGMSRQTLQSSLDYIARKYRIKPDVSLWRQPQPAIPDKPDHDAQAAQRMQDRLAYAEAQLRAVRRDESLCDEIRRTAFALAGSPPVPPKWIAASGGKRHMQSVPVLMTSDFQWGEVIRAEEVDGVNEYNPAIARARYRRLIEKTVSLCFDHMTKPDYPGIFYLRGGDSISGDIHDELRETNELSPNPAVKDLAGEEIRGIQILAERFGRVHVISVPGNHGRTTIKDRSKRYADLSWDDMLSFVIESHFRARGDGRVTFETPRSGDAYFTVCGKRVLLTHGNRIGSRGGTGFIGPVATIVRGAKKVKDQYARLGKPVDIMFIDHFHTCCEPAPNVFSNGSLPGFGEYAVTIRAEPEPPMQWLLFLHPRWGVTAQWKIRVDDPKEEKWHWPEAIA